MKALSKIYCKSKKTGNLLMHIKSCGSHLHAGFSSQNTVSYKYLYIAKENRHECLMTFVMVQSVRVEVKLKCFYSGGVVKCTYFHKKRSIPLMKNPHKKTHWIY